MSQGCPRAATGLSRGCYGECDRNGKFTVLLSRFLYFGRYRHSKFGQNPKNVVFWARFAMVTVFFGPNRLILIKATQCRYWAAMLGSVYRSVPLCFGQCLLCRSVLLRPVILCIYLNCHLVPVGAGFAEITGTAVFL